MLATDKDGDISWKSVQESFGAVNALQHQSRISMNLRFPGQYYDQETGTHYNFHRDYKPNAGRYVQSDPIGLEGGVNMYGYVGAAPLLYFDYFGLCRGWWIRVNFVDDPIGIGPLRGCVCNWICRPCEGSNIEPLSGDITIITAHRTRGVKYFNPKKSSDLESGNDCSCGKPSKELECDSCAK